MTLLELERDRKTQRAINLRRKHETRRARRWSAGPRSLASLIASATALLFVCSGAAQAQIVINVSDAPSLVAALTTADTNPGNSYRINFTQNITLTAAASNTLPAINTTSPLIISGNNFALNGGGVQSGFFIFSGTVAVNDLSITNARAIGGSGSTGGGASGGGLGAGGALFVASGGNLTVSNVSLTTNSATGGAGTGGAGGVGGGGGGLGGNGGVNCCGAGGGGVGLGANGGIGAGTAGAAGIVLGATGGGSGTGGAAAGGANGGGGGGNGNSGGGGGVGGQNAGAGVGGSGGFGGGGGGGPNIGGAGGFGGGGGGSIGIGGAGGFGGGGASGGTPGAGGFGGGNATGAGGGGGAGLGGAIFVTGGGTLTLAGPLVINGNTVTAGLGAAGGGNGSAFGAGIFLQGNGNLTFQPGAGQTQTIANIIADQTGSGGSGTFASGGPSCTSGVGCGAYSGTGSWSITKTGAGTLILSAVNAYTGATNVNAGALEVDGSIATSPLTTINNGGTLLGVGKVGNTQVNGGGTFAPGAAGMPGTSMTVSGNLAFQSGAIYLVQLNPTSNTLANVTGTATLNGNVLAAFAPGSYKSKQYDILHATSLSGTFAAVGTTNLPNFAASLSYTSTDVFLNLTASLGAGTPLNQNQQNVATSLTNFFNSVGTLTPNFLAIFGLSGGNLAAALSQLSGEVATDAQTGAFQHMTEFLGLMVDPSIDGRDNTAGSSMPPHAFAEENAYTAEKKSSVSNDASRAFARYVKAPPLAPVYQPRWSAWAAGYGGYNKTDGDPVVGSNDVVTRTGGGAAGADYHFSPDALVGFALAGGGTSWGLAQGLGTGQADVFQAGLYGKGYIGPAYIAASIAFADHWMTTNRTAPLGDQLQARFNGQNYGGRLESGYRFAVLPAFGITPYAAVQAQSFHTPTYSEMDLTAGGFGLTFNSRSATDTRSELGARFDALTMLGAMPLTLRARLAWAHDWISNPVLNAAFETLPGAGFTVNGAAPPKDRALTTLGADLRIAPNWILAAKLDGEFATHSQTYAGTGKVTYTW
jgi:uncharacterized protein with beta-barrel porin domain